MSGVKTDREAVASVAAVAVDVAGRAVHEVAGIPILTLDLAGGIQQDGLADRLAIQSSISSLWAKTLALESRSSRRIGRS